MKGKLYQPTCKQSISERVLKTRPKPWNQTPKVPSIYFWKSSIPDKYIKDQSRVFKHVSETKRTKNTQEFLKKNLKYIESIANSHRITPSLRASIINSQQDSSDDELEHTDPKNSKFFLQKDPKFDSFKDKMHQIDKSVSNKGLKTFESSEICVGNPVHNMETLKGPTKLPYRRASLPKLFAAKDEEVESKVLSSVRATKGALKKKLEMISPRIIHTGARQINKRSSVS